MFAQRFGHGLILQIHLNVGALHLIAKELQATLVDLGLQRLTRHNKHEYVAIQRICGTTQRVQLDGSCALAALKFGYSGMGYAQAARQILTCHSQTVANGSHPPPSRR